MQSLRKQVPWRCHFTPKELTQAQSPLSIAPSGPFLLSQFHSVFPKALHLGIIRDCCFFLIFSWRITALQCCICLWHTSTWIWGVCVCVCVCVCVSPPSWGPLPPATPSHPSRTTTSTRSHSKLLLAVSFTYGKVYVSTLLSQFVPLSILPPSHCVHKSVL